MVARFGARTVMVTGGILFSLMLCLLGLAANSWQLVLALFLFGFTRNLFNISVNTSAVEVQQLYNKPIISTFHGLWSLACFIAAGIGTLIIAQDIGTGTHFLLIAVVCAFLSFVFKGNQQAVRLATSEKRPFFIKPDRYLLLLGSITFCSMLCEGTMFDWSVSYFEKIVGAPKSSVTVGYTSFIIAMSVGRLAGDRIVARFGVPKVLMVNGLLMAAGLCLVIFLPYFLPAALGFLLVGAGNSIMVPQVYSLASKSKKMKASYAIASVTLIGYIGFLIGPVLIGSISEAFGMQWSFALVAVLCICICLLTARVKKLGSKID
jgi:MFS family permease